MSSQTETWHARAAKLQRQTKHKKLTPSDRRMNSQAALAADQEFQQRLLSEKFERPEVREARLQELTDHRWNSIFAPTENPRSLLPAAYGGRFPVLSEDSPGPRLRTAIDPPVLDEDEAAVLLRVCSLFSRLATMNGALCPPAVLTRSGLCRMVCALSGLSMAPGERTWLAKAAEHFDAFAERLPNPNTGGQVIGLSLNLPLNEKSKPVDKGTLPVCRLFARMLLFMIDEVRSFGVNEADDRFSKILAAKRRLFEVLLPEAEEYAGERAEFVQLRLEAGGPPRQQQRATPAAPGSPPPPKPDAVVKETPEGGSCCSTGNLSKQGSQRLQRRKRMDSDSSEWMSGSECEGARGSAASEAVAAGGDGAGPATLYSRTFTMLKGEALKSHLLEPEVVHFIVTFAGLFGIIFRAYCDVPARGCDGHMSQMAFLRVCTDFGIFPDIADLQTIEWLYSTAEGCIAIKPALRKAGSKSSVSTSSPPPVLAQSTDRKRRHRRGSVSNQRNDDGFLFFGKWLKHHLAWLTKDFGEMTATEVSAASILWAVSEWIDWHRMSVREFFVFLDRDGNGTISEEEMQRAVAFMDFESPPDCEAVRRMMALIVPPGPGVCSPQEQKLEVEYATLHMALVAVGKRREHRDRAANCFLKDFSKMTQLESKTCVFMRVLWELLEKKQLTPEQLFNIVDEDGSGSITAEELSTHTQQMIKLHISRKNALAALAVESPFEMLDTNQDGQVSLGEFCDICEKARQAKTMRALLDEDKQQIFLSTSALRPKGEARSIFSTRAFIECLLKVAFVHLGYHGTSAQAEQPAFVKATWLLVYMHWHLNKARDKASEAASAQSAELDPLRNNTDKMVDTFSKRLSVKSGAPARLSQTSRDQAEAGGASQPAFLAPMQRLLKHHPRMFVDAPEVPPALAGSTDSRPGTAASAGSCIGWGKYADPALVMCLGVYTEGCPDAAGERSLDRELLSVATGCGSRSA